MPRGNLRLGEVARDIRMRSERPGVSGGRPTPPRKAPGAGCLRAQRSHSGSIEVMVSSSAVAGHATTRRGASAASQTCKLALEPTPGIEPGTSSLPRISLPALWHTPGDRERNASKYGVVSFRRSLFSCSVGPERCSVDPHGSKITLNDHRQNGIFVAKGRSSFD